MLSVDWDAAVQGLRQEGLATVGPVLAPSEAQELAAAYRDEHRFRERVILEERGFGTGEYKYFADPLPEVVQAIRSAAYPALSGLANEWCQALGVEQYPDTLDEFLQRSHSAGQTAPAPLMLRYGPGGVNGLHQDLYGDVYFPVQLVIMLSREGPDYDGGEFVTVEEHEDGLAQPRVARAPQGHGILWPTCWRVTGSRNSKRRVVRHGVARVRRGERFSLGIIFHDA
jgi:hypothetical protein